MSTPENIRYHAAGHIASAHALAQKGDGEAARYVLGIVKQYIEQPSVSAPPAMAELLDTAIAEPITRLDEMATLEQWFVDPFNTIIENSGATFR